MKRNRGSSATSSAVAGKSTLIATHEGASRLFGQERRGAKGSRTTTGETLERLDITVRELNTYRAQLQRRKASSATPALVGTLPYSKWLAALQKGRSVLISGVGEKRGVLDALAGRLSREDVVLMEERCTVREALDTLARDLLRRDVRSRSLSLLHYTHEVVGLLNAHYRRASARATITADTLPTGSARSTALARDPGPRAEDDDSADEAGPEAANEGGGWSNADTCVSMDFCADDSGRSGRRQSSRQRQHDVAEDKGKYMYMKAMAYILVDRIESRSRSSHEAQQCLSLLAECPSVGLVATTDQLNAPLLWDAEALARYRWTHETLSTYAPFELGDAALSAMLGRPEIARGGGGADGGGFEYVLTSLSNSHKEALAVLCKAHIAALEKNKASKRAATASGPGTGVGMREVFLTCRRAMIVQDQPALDRLLRELLDHQMIAISPDAAKIVSLKLPLDLIQKIAEED